VTYQFLISQACTCFLSGKVLPVLSVLSVVCPKVLNLSPAGDLCRHAAFGAHFETKWRTSSTVRTAVMPTQGPGSPYMKRRIFFILYSKGAGGRGKPTWKTVLQRKDHPTVVGSQSHVKDFSISQVFLF